MREILSLMLYLIKIYVVWGSEASLLTVDAQKLQQQGTELAEGNLTLVHPSTTRVPVLGGVVF